MAPTTPSATLEHLSRLANKPGVQSTLILSKSDGSIIRSTGLLASVSTSSDEDGASNGASQNELGDPTSPLRAGTEYKRNESGSQKGNTAEDVARMVFAFVAASNSFTVGLDKSDEVKLLRLRTRKNEIVIVPDPKFLLVVIHDTPPA
ncbi:hypothetical protein MMC21_006499 [Puttea exsequens]|nr:hypothetical protein [Puttea exsequens]